MSEDRIFIKDLMLRGIIGLNDWERKNRQDILINVELFTDIRMAGENDDIDCSVNYRTVTKKIIKYVETEEPLTVETLATDIARLSLEEERVERVRVRVEKPGAVRFASSVGVDILRSREDFG